MSIVEEDEPPLVSPGDIVGTERERDSGGVCLEIEGLDTEVPVCVRFVCVLVTNNHHTRRTTYG